MTNTINVTAHEWNFFKIKSVLGTMVRRIDYPEPYDPSYLFVAEVPDNMLDNIRKALQTIREERG